MITKRILAVITVIGIAAPAAAAAATAAAQVPELTLERIYASRDYTPKQVEVQWMGDGRHYTELEPVAEGRADLYRVDARSGERELLVKGSDLVPGPGAEPILIEDYTFSADESKLLIFSDVERIWRHSERGTYWVWDLEEQRLTPVSRKPGLQLYAKLSPNAERVAFVRDHNIYITELASGEEVALTEDGDENVINGASDWVYEEELVLSDAFRWSPDGRRIAFWRFDQSAIPPFYLINQMALYPKLEAVRYPKAGTDNSQVQLGVIDLETGKTRWIDSGVDPDGYIARMEFANSSTEIWFQTLNRHQNRMELKLADLETGRSHTIMADTDPAWVDLNEPEWIEGGDRFVYLSERDGYAHLYLFERDGDLVGKLTDGEWDVAELVGADSKRKIVYFTGYADGPLARPLYRVGLNGSGFERISPPVGRSAATFDPTYTYYIDSYSKAGVPPVVTLRKADGKAVRTLEGNSAMRDRLEALGLNPPEFIKIPVDGAELNAWLLKPPDFDPAKTYPLLMYVYGGPGSQTVTDSWGGDRYLWHQIMAREGYLVASVDNRGTGGRGVDFKKITYLNLGEYETADQIAAARHLGGLPYVDASRIGIWGWSYGAYMASLSLFRGSDVFKAAISVAPVTHWRLYDTIYTERYMRTPEENPDGYARSAPLTYADRLQGNFLLVHGTGDDNVHPQNSILLVERLIESNKQFDFRVYPNKAHSISGPSFRVNLFEMMTAFLQENL